MIRSALGKSVDMNALIAKNEKVRAVGNMKVNARGDTIDSFGRVIKPATEKVNERYSKTVGNRSAQLNKQNKAKQNVAYETLTPDEKALEEDLDFDLEVEAIKAKERDKND